RRTPDYRGAESPRRRDENHRVDGLTWRRTPSSAGAATAALTRGGRTRTSAPTIKNELPRFSVAPCSCSAIRGRIAADSLTVYACRVRRCRRRAADERRAAWHRDSRPATMTER